MKEEIHRLRVKITEQEGLLQDTIERLRSTNRTKESMEHFIVNQREDHSLDSPPHSGDTFETQPMLH